MLYSWLLYLGNKSFSFLLIILWFIIPMVKTHIFSFCRFEDDKTISSLYEDLWDENMSNERITLQLFLGEITDLINEGITSSSWASKKKACLIFPLPRAASFFLNSIIEVIRCGHTILLIMDSLICVIKALNC